MQSTVYQILNKFLFILLVLFSSCIDRDQSPLPEATNRKKQKDYIRPIPGKSDTIPQAIKERGEVLIAYSDCYTCHTIDIRSKGPSFKDIAKRYPVTDAYVISE
jgi:cytochrome c